MQQPSMYKNNWNLSTSLIFACLLVIPCFFTLVSCYDRNKENNLFDEGPGTALALDEIDPDAPQLLKAYKESYITRTAAKKFLDKMKNYRDTHTAVEYKKFFDDIAFNPINSNLENGGGSGTKATNGVTFYSKKYFDYLPTDEIKSSSDKSSDELVELLSPPPMAPPASYGQPHQQKQRENHRRFKRNLNYMVPAYFIPQPDRYYLPVPPPQEQPQQPQPTLIGNRNNFDLTNGLIFDYQYDPIRTGFGFNNGFNTVSNQYPTRPSSTWTTTRPPARLPPITQRPPQRNPPPASIYFPTQPPSYATTTVRPINQQDDYGNRGRPGSNTKKGTTTQAPDIFHSSDYDDDLDLTNRFGVEGDEPHKCTWAIVNCCGGQNASKRDRCFRIFGCGKLLQRQPDSCGPERIRQAQYEKDSFLNSNRKK